MRYVINYSTKNGLGEPAISIYLKGCDKPNKCIGCHNGFYQAQPDEKIDYTALTQTLDRQMHLMSLTHQTLHIAFLGGEPLAAYNRSAVKKISSHIKQCYPQAKTTLYTYRTLTDIKREQLENFINDIDYGVLGEFMMDELDTSFIPASKNQVIYDFKTKKVLLPIQI